MTSPGPETTAGRIPHRWRCNGFERWPDPRWSWECDYCGDSATTADERGPVPHDDTACPGPHRRRCGHCGGWVEHGVIWCSCALVTDRNPA